MKEIVFKCACGRNTTHGPRCIFCSRETEQEDLSNVDLEELEAYLECEEFLEDESNDDA